MIREEAQRQGYVPNLNAQLLKGQRSQTIGLIVPTTPAHIPDPFFSAFVTGVAEQAAHAGFDVLLSTGSVEDLHLYQRMVVRHHVDGVILARIQQNDPRVTYLIETGMPFAAFGRTQANEDSAASFSHIDVDGRAGQYTLTQHLINLGHTHIAYIHPPLNYTFGQQRLEGFAQAMAEAGLTPERSIQKPGNLSEAAGRAAAEHLLTLDRPPTAIMAGNDLMAFGIMRAVQAHGLRVGVDISVAGFDDVHTAEYVHPGLTTMHQPIYEIGQRLVTLLLDTLAGAQTQPRSYLLMPELIVRASTGYAPQ